MAKLGIGTGTIPDDGTGDSLLDGAVKINSNFDEIYTYFGDGTNLNFSSGLWQSTGAGIHTTSNVGVGTTNPRFDLEVGAVGSSGTSLWVNGDARITGILTVGTSSITLNGSSNKITVGSGVTIDGNTGIISATAFYAGGSIISGGGGGSGDSYWGVVASGISTTANVAIGTVTPTSKLTVAGNSLFSGIATFSGTSNFGTINAQTLNVNTAGVNIANDIPIYFGSAAQGYISYASGLFQIRGPGGTTSLVLGAGPAAGANVRITSGDANTNYAVFSGTGVTVTGTTFTNELSVSGIATIGPVAAGTTSLYLGGPLKVGEIDISGGNNSVHVGQGAGRKNYNGGSGQQNTAVGYNALGVNQASNFNTAFGISALGALGNTLFSNYDENTAIGAHAGSSLLTGNANTFVGRSSGASITSGTRNTILGKYNGNQNGLDIRTSSNNVVLSDGDGNIRFYANSSGNVGLGTTNPTEKLTVRGGDISVGVSTAHGVILTSPNGTQYRLIVDDAGALSTVAI